MSTGDSAESQFDVHGEGSTRADGGQLRQLHSFLEEQDPKKEFGGLIRVQNKRRQFLWVHPQFVEEY